jgi:uncharacterized OB-fold protein
MGILRKVEKAEKVREIKGDFPVKFKYTMPAHHEKFFQNLKETGKFTGVKCEKCNTTYVPPVAFCEKCFVRVDKMIEIRDTGILQAFSVAHEGPEGQPLSAPVVYGLVRLRGASTVILHKVLAEPKKLEPGMKVKAQLKPQSKRKGSITDIEGFVPVPV